MSDLVELCGLWKSDDERYMSGTMGGCKVFVFTNMHRTNDRAPTHRLYVGKLKPKPRPDGSKAEQTSREPFIDDIPF